MNLLGMVSIGALCAACGTLTRDPLSPGGRLEGTDGALHEIRPRGAHQYTVLVFFYVGCRHLDAHDGRLRRLASEYGTRGVQFFAVDSELNGTLATDRAEVVRHGYPFPILRDPGARLARALQAHHAGFTAVLGTDGKVLYRGGLDSDRFQLHEDRTPYLADALTDLLAGRQPRRPETEVLGCALEP